MTQIEKTQIEKIKAGIEDERIRKELIGYLTHRAEVTGFIDEDKDCKRWIAYLEKQKEQKPESCDCSRDEESYTNGIHHVLMNPEAYGLIKQQPAEWSEEDDALLKEFVSFFKDGTVKLQHDLDLYAGFLEKKFKFLRPQPHWKPSEEQMDHLAYAYTQLKLQKCYAPHVYESLGSLYDDLKKHFSL